MMGQSEFSKKQLVFVFVNAEEKLSFRNDNLIVTTKEGIIKYQSTCYKIFALYLVGNITITSGLIQRAHKFCFPIILLNPNLRAYDRIGFQAEGNTILRRRQYELSAAERLEIARWLIENKLANQAMALRKQRHRTDATNEALAWVEKALRAASGASCAQELLGFEGSAARAYFKAQFNNCTWVSRKPRVKPDYINATLDIGYTLLFNLIESMLNLYGFDTYVGVLHTEFYMRKSLVCDIVEPFRPLIDYQVRKAISLRQCKPEDFEIMNNTWVLKYSKSKAYTLFLLEPLVQHKDDIFRFIQSFYRAFVQRKPVSEYPQFRME